MTTIYADLAKKTSAKDVEALYRRRYAKEPFVRVTPAASTATVRGSNFCDVSVHVDERNGKLVVVSCIDNLVKGQAGNAIQNANLLLGLDEREGLFFPGSIP
jgi:N-acetyl-gamma-glutamyl-phosphate reductase